MIGRLLRSYRKSKEAEEERKQLLAGLPYCPRCGKDARTGCIVCRGETSPEARKANILAFRKRQEFADREVMALVGHLRFASPVVQAEFLNVLRGLLAADFAEANKGKWTGDVALGLGVGNLFNSITGD